MRIPRLGSANDLSELGLIENRFRESVVYAAGDAGVTKSPLIRDARPWIGVLDPEDLHLLLGQAGRGIRRSAATWLRRRSCGCRRQNAIAHAVVLIVR